jgi:microcystin degradation protein MlrC
VFAYADDPAAADRAAKLMLRAVADAEARFGEPILTAADAVATASRLAGNSKAPVVLADTQDNPGAGGASDTTGLLKALILGKAEGALVAVMHDPAAALAAHEAGVGAVIDIALGGQSDGEPLRASYRVKALADGPFAGTGPMMEGATMNLGRMALLETGGVEIVVGSSRSQPLSQAILNHVGVEPTERKILALKSSVHFRAHFQDLAAAVLVVAAPGANLASPADFPYKNLRDGVRVTLKTA